MKYLSTVLLLMVPALSGVLAAVVLDFEMMSEPESWEMAVQPGLTVWLPNEDIAERWRALHRP